MLKKVIKFVNESFQQGGRGGGIKHFERTLFWIKQLKPDADEPMLMAAYAHDIQRAFRKTNTDETFRDMNMNDAEFLRMHQDEGARIIEDFLRDNNYDEEKILRVCNIKHHEEGGDKESDLIKDADSLSYFETSVLKHTQETAKVLGKEKVRKKVDWMYSRITSGKAKKLAEPNYKKAIELLNTQSL